MEPFHKLLTDSKNVPFKYETKAVCTLNSQTLGSERRWIMFHRVVNRARVLFALAAVLKPEIGTTSVSQHSSKWLFLHQRDWSWWGVGSPVCLWGSARIGSGKRSQEHTLKVSLWIEAKHQEAVVVTEVEPSSGSPHHSRFCWNRLDAGLHRMSDTETRQGRRRRRRTAWSGDLIRKSVIWEEPRRPFQTFSITTAPKFGVLFQCNSTVTMATLPLQVIPTYYRLITKLHT